MLAASGSVGTGPGEPAGRVRTRAGGVDMGDEDRGVAGGTGDDRPQGTAAPTPARAAMAPPPAPDDAPTPGPVRTVGVDGDLWSVRVLGRTLGGGSPTAVSLLLLGFVGPEGTHSGRREAWVAARSLDELSPLRLEAACREALPPRDPWAPAPFFPEIAARGGKDG